MTSLRLVPISKNFTNRQTVSSFKVVCVVDGADDSVCCQLDNSKIRLISIYQFDINFCKKNCVIVEPQFLIDALFLFLIQLKYYRTRNDLARSIYNNCTSQWDGLFLINIFKQIKLNGNRTVECSNAIDPSKCVKRPTS